ncbi:DNA translocase FtsK [Bacillus sp. REN10]|uniref:DNA translocase FtsK n=1 Tax=Bacillus sp. REN10 TaxID=2782541 RepID=UPI00193BE78F|nr:DNA translocase FtsK [Bacillus sp. REN10]
MHQLSLLEVADKLFFKKDEPQPFTVKAKGDKFIVATVEDGDHKRYTIIDTEKGVCGPHDRTFNPYDFTKQQDIDKCLSDMVAGEYGIKISRRHSAPIEDVIDVEETLYQKALDFLTVIKELDDLYPSISTFQRRFRIGFATADRMINRMEKEGYISEFIGGVPRKVLKTKRYGHWE